MSDTFQKYLHECFQGEVLGEALGAALAESAQDPDHGQKWRFLEQLERERAHPSRTRSPRGASGRGSSQEE